MALNGTTPGLATLPLAPKAPGTVGALGAYAAPKPPVDYGQAFQSALGQARGSIQQQLGAALGDIQNSQAAAGQALGQLPGQINASYGQANGSINDATNAISQAQKNSGIGSLMPLGAYLAPERAAIAGSQAAAQANVPLLATGIQEQGARMRAMANMAAMGGNQQLDQATMQNAMQQQNALQGYNYSKQLQDDPNRNFGPSGGQTAASAQVIDPTTGISRGFTQGDVQAAVKSPDYTKAVADIHWAQGIKDTKQSAQIQGRLWAGLQKQYADNPAMLAALAQIFPNSKPPDVIANTPGQSMADYGAQQQAKKSALQAFQWGF